MNNEEIVTRLDEEIRNSVGYSSGELADQRKEALEYYYGKPFGNEVEGRSSYVSRDVADTIEWIMPSLMRIFTAGDTIVRFEPNGPEDEKGAKQATDYVNYIFQRQNDGFLTLYTWFKDALLAKNGFVKVYYEKYQDYKTERYEGLTEDEMVYVAQGSEILEHSEYPGPTEILHDIKIRKTEKTGKCCVVPVPPEEFLVNKYPTAPLKNNRFQCHRRQISISELKEMGYKDVDDLKSDESAEFNEERIARFAFDETDEGQDLKDVNRLVWLEEALVNLDVDGDGIAERRKIIKVGSRILENEEDESTRFVTLTPIILPHKLFGMSVADLVMDLQLLKSTVFRQILDNMYLANNGRYMALEGMVNIDDLLTSRPGGIVRVKTFDAVKPMQPPLLGAPAFSLLEYIDTVKENRTGVSRAPLDPDAISKHATGAAIIDQATQSRIELIARVFAETGVKDLFYAILECVQKHQDKAKVIRLNNEWVPMDPREWNSKYDMTVSVGLGTGSKEKLFAALVQEQQIQLAMLGNGVPVVTPMNLYHTSVEKLKAAGIKGVDAFYTSPDKIPPRPPQPDPAIIKAQMDNQTKLQTAGIKDQTARWKHATNLMTKEKQMQVQVQSSQEDKAHDLRSKVMDQMHEMRLNQPTDPRLQLILDKHEIDRDDELELLDILLTAENDRRRADSKSGAGQTATQ